MNMKRYMVLSLLVLGIPFFSPALEVDFSVTLADLYRAAERGDDSHIPFERYFILDGDIGSILIIDDSEQTLYAEVELIGGEWHGDESVEMHRAIIVFEGSRFYPLFSRDSSRRLELSQHVIIYANYLGLGTDFDDVHVIPVIEALDIRILY